jgi:hypothetical protein
MTNQVHLRRIDLERLSAGEAVADASHLAHCDACAAAVESIRLEARTFVQRRPAATVLEQVRARRAPWWRRWWPVVAVPLAACLAFLVFTGLKMWWAAGQEPDLGSNPALKWINRTFKVAKDYMRPYVNPVEFIEKERKKLEEEKKQSKKFPAELVRQRQSSRRRAV